MLETSAVKEIFASLKSLFEESTVPSKTVNFQEALEITRCFTLKPTSE